jgi:hypothetical protein
VFRPMLAVFLHGGRDSVLLVAVVHSLFNRTNNDNGVLAGLTASGGANGGAVLLTAVAVTVAAALVLRRRLGRAYRVELDGTTPTSPFRPWTSPIPPPQELSWTCSNPPPTSRRRPRPACCA